MHTVFKTVCGIAATVMVVSAAGAAGQTRTPTKDDPIRYRAFAVQLQGGRSGQVDIAIERWTTDAEREKLIGLAMKAKEGEPGQRDLLEGLQDIRPRVGYIKLPNTLGWDLKYANHDVLPDGSRRIVIVTDKPVSFFAARNQTRTMDYPFTLIEMRFPAEGDKGEGKLLNMTSISTKDGKLQLELYGQEPTRLTTITEQKGKS